MKLTIAAVVALLIGLAAGAGLAGYVLRGEPAAVVRVGVGGQVDLDAKRVLELAEVSAFLAKAEADGAAGELDALAGSLRRIDGGDLSKALLAYADTLSPLAEALREAEAADSGFGAAAGKTWAAVKGLVGDEKRTKPGLAEVRAATADVEAAAADLAVAAEAAGLDVRAACPTLPGVEGLDSTGS